VGFLAQGSGLRAQGAEQKTKDKSRKMNRSDFFKKLIRYLLLMVLAIIAVFLGNRVVTGSNCSSCAGKGICRGDESDCSNYLSE